MLKKVKNIRKNPWFLWLWNEQRRIKGEISFKKVRDEELIKKYYFDTFGRYPDLENPQTFNEKMQWLKLNYRKPIMSQCADKYKVRDYLIKKGYSEILNEIIGVYDEVDEIDLEKLPDMFVLKATHGSGWILIVKDKTTIDWIAWKLVMKSWLKQNFYYYGREWAYKDIKPRIVCEKFLEDSKGELLDYKFHCFNGEPKFIQVDKDRFISHKRNLYDLNWELLDMKLIYDNSEKNIDKPKQLIEMIKMSRELSKDFPYLRVDFYEVDGKIYFGELTFYSESGVGKFLGTSDDDYSVGELLELVLD